jgi:tetrahydromethanopterin S-methyltransferase subunit G
MSIKELLEQHIHADHDDFRLVHEKLDKLLAEVHSLKGQWKVISAITGAVFGAIIGVFF